MSDRKKRLSWTVLGLHLLILLAIAGGSAYAGDTTAPLIVSGHPDRPPFVYQVGEHIAGFCPDLAGAILARLGVAYESRFMGPWKRVQERASHGQVDMIAGLFWRAERERYLVYSDPIFDDPISVYITKGKKIAIADRWDLIHYSGVTLFGDSFGEGLDRLIDNELRMVRVYTPPEMFDLLLNHKVDYLLFGYYAGLITAHRLGVADKIVVAKKDLVVEKAYLAISRESPYVGLLPAINREIQHLKTKGVIDKLINEHLNRYLAGVHR